MEQRTNALQEALINNSNEIARWECYRKENETAIENLNRFSKRLTVDVMVPVGRKAFMPGKLIHTNELLVGHYQGYFSKCSAHKAEEICKHRIHNAAEHLKKLQTEMELWQNKLEKPYLDGVLPNEELLEIVEEYDEKNEQRWREAHELSLKRSKLAERDNEPTKSEEEIFSLLDEYELMEELEEYDFKADELTAETVQQLISGELQLPPSKSRVALKTKSNENFIKQNPEMEKIKDTKQKYGVVKKADLNSQSIENPAANNNFQPNPAIECSLTEDLIDDDMPEEVIFLRDQAKYLSPRDQIIFYDSQIKIIKKKIRALSLPKPQDEVNEKIHLYFVLESLSDLMEIAEGTAADEELSDVESISNEEDIEPTIAVNENKQRRISFALEDQTLIFRGNEPVTQMMYQETKETPLNTDEQKRDIIRLEDDVINTFAPEFATSVDKRQKILEKVEKNMHHFAENQSMQDSDIVHQLINTSLDNSRTFHIKFKHSTHSDYDDISSKPATSIQEQLPGTPADFYDLYVAALESRKPKSRSLFVNGYKGEEEVVTPLLRETIRQQAYEDPRAEFSNPIVNKKSILLNRTPLKNKNSNSEKSKKPNQPERVDEPLSAYEKVVGEVMENTTLTSPEPLPAGKFIDAHTPKKRVSRFKQMRTDTMNT